MSKRVPKLLIIEICHSCQTLKFPSSFFKGLKNGFACLSNRWAKSRAILDGYNGSEKIIDMNVFNGSKE